ncbi:YdiU family protein [Paenibacillus sp. NPDC058071]|uniref:protein adenylyltransferase SelO n=1 Tax=Paenibacillus sp. NPDC058071 TaxID=3346326 RepID=UPI0036D88B2A
MNDKVAIGAETGWHFDNSYARLPEKLFTPLGPRSVSVPKLAVLNDRLALSLGLDPEALRTESGAAVLAGGAMPTGAFPLAQAYAGHQFGHFNRLGDGRAMLIGEQLAPNGERYDIQLKGSGRTPYSRGGDGLAALGPMLREYIISEAMHGLGIPTTRSLAVTETGESIVREKLLPGAVLARVAASHLRVGTFQFVSAWGTKEELRALADYTVSRHYPEIAEEGGSGRYLALLQGVMERQAALVAKWQLVGFIHGVMNTDNMALSGETIDYGPCAFMDGYHPGTVFSSIDSEGRYAYGNQPYIASWNLARFAETLLPLLDESMDHAVKIAEEAIHAFPDRYYANWLSGMRAKLGLIGEEAEDEALIEELLTMMRDAGADYTNTFLAFTFDTPVEPSLSGHASFAEWYVKWRARAGGGAEREATSRQLMRNSNPAVIPRNHRVEEALEAAEKQGDYSVMERLLTALENPYAHTDQQREYASPAGDSDRPYRTYCGT